MNLSSHARYLQKITHFYIAVERRRDAYLLQIKCPEVYAKDGELDRFMYFYFNGNTRKYSER